MRRSMMIFATSLSLFALAVGAKPAFATQVGATGELNQSEVGALTTMSQPSQFVDGYAARTYWLGVTFPNGYFFQAGYLDPQGDWADQCQTGFSWFVTALSPSGGTPFPKLYNSGYCNLYGTRTFQVRIVSRSESAVYWQWYMDGPGGGWIGPQLGFPTSQDHFLEANVGPDSEIVSNSTPDGIAFPTVTYSAAAKVLDPGASYFRLVLHGRFVASSNRTCYFAMNYLAQDVIRTGDKYTIGATTCYSTGQAVW